MCLFSICVDFEQLLDIVYWKIEILKYNSTVHKKTQTVIYFPQKSIIFTFLSICVLKIFYQHSVHNLFYIQIPLNIQFFFFSTHKLYTTLNNLHKITFIPYKCYNLLHSGPTYFFCYNFHYSDPV